jgi:hypothetical protein
MNKSILPPMIIAFALITYRGAVSGSSAQNPVAHLPLPSEYVGAALAFGLLSLASGQASQPATLIAWGLDVAILLNLWQPGKTVQATNTAKQQTAVAPTSKG